MLSDIEAAYAAGILDAFRLLTLVLLSLPMKESISRCRAYLFRESPLRISIGKPSLIKPDFACRITAAGGSMWLLKNPRPKDSTTDLYKLSRAIWLSPVSAPRNRVRRGLAANLPARSFAQFAAD